MAQWSFMAVEPFIFMHVCKGVVSLFETVKGDKKIKFPLTAVNRNFTTQKLN